jgi:hypothetical protein
MGTTKSSQQMGTKALQQMGTKALQQTGFNTLEDIYNHFDFRIDELSNCELKYLENYILNLFNNEIINEVSQDSNIYLWNGIFYYTFKKDYEKMKKHYLMAIELNNSSAMLYLGDYYCYEKDYENMKKYYLMAVGLNNSRAMYCLGNYYFNIEKDYENMKKYYIMAIKLNLSEAMNNLKASINRIELYNILINLPPNEIINKKLVELENNRDIIHFKNKIKFMKSLNNIKECPICLYTKLNIYFDFCCHQCCIDCYVKMDKCFYNCR